MKSADQCLILFKGAVCLMAAVQTACFSIFDYLPSPPHGYSDLVIITNYNFVTFTNMSRCVKRRENPVKT